MTAASHEIQPCQLKVLSSYWQNNSPVELDLLDISSPKQKQHSLETEIQNFSDSQHYINHYFTGYIFEGLYGNI